MLTLRALIYREGGLSVATCMDHFVTGNGANDAEAVDALAVALKASREARGLEALPQAPDEYQKRYSDSMRQSTTLRGDFLLHVRAG